MSDTTASGGRSPYRPITESAVAPQEDGPTDVFCDNCHAQISVQGLATNAEVRCAGCGNQFGLDTVVGDMSPKNTKATVSAILGCLSFIGMFVTAIPAVIFGLRALSDIRERKTQVGRKRAVVGVTTGGLFGFFCSCTTLFFLLWIPSLRPKTDAESIARVEARIGTFDLPNGIKVKNVQSTPGVDHYRAEDAGDATLIWITVIDKSFAPNEASARAQFLGARMTVGGGVKKHSTHRFKVDGKMVEVLEERGQIDGEEVSVFTAVIEREKDWVLFFVRTEAGYDGSETEGPKRYSVNAEDVEKMLGSYMPPIKKDDEESQ